MEKFGLSNYIKAVHFVRGAYYAGKNAINADKTLSELGRKAQLARLVQQLEKVFTDDIYADYANQKRMTAKLIEMHMAGKPKPAQPTPETMALENRAHKQIMTRLALAGDVGSVLAVLKEVAANGTPIDKTALLVNYADVMQAAQSKILSTGAGLNESGGADLWDSNVKPGDLQQNGNAAQAAQQAKLLDTLKSIFTNTQNSLKTKKEIEFESKLAEYVDMDANTNANLSTAQRLFSKMWTDEFSTDLAVKTEKIVIDPWEPELQPQEDTFITASRNIGKIG